MILSNVLFSIFIIIKNIRTQYPLWEYPIIGIGLFIFLKRHRFKLKAIKAHRMSIGINDFSLPRVIEFGHWFVAEELSLLWWYGGR
jgi:hypothetical protein